MVTREVERGILKCHRYWPDEEGSTLAFAQISVKLVKQETQSTFTQRTFEVTFGDSPLRTVTQLCFESWPDHVSCMGLHVH